MISTSSPSVNDGGLTKSFSVKRICPFFTWTVAHLRSYFFGNCVFFLAICISSPFYVSVADFQNVIDQVTDDYPCAIKNDVINMTYACF